MSAVRQVRESGSQIPYVRSGRRRDPHAISIFVHREPPTIQGSVQMKAQEFKVTGEPRAT